MEEIKSIYELRRQLKVYRGKYRKMAKIAILRLPFQTTEDQYYEWLNKLSQGKIGKDPGHFKVQAMLTVIAEWDELERENESTRN